MSKRPKKTEEVSEDVTILNKRQKKILNHSFQLKEISPITDTQKKAFQSYFEGKNLLMHGYAGTGKSFVALYLALNDLFRGMVKKIIIVRSATPTRDVGFLPGTIEEKMAMYEGAYEEIIDNLCSQKGAYDILKKKEAIEFCSTSFLRGRTFNDSIIILDESQSCVLHEIDTVITRTGKNSKIFLLGDLLQNDLENIRKKEMSGFEDAIQICGSMKSFDIIKFEISDVVRSGLAKEWILARYLNKKY